MTYKCCGSSLITTVSAGPTRTASLQTSPSCRHDAAHLCSSLLIAHGQSRSIIFLSTAMVCYSFAFVVNNYKLSIMTL